MILIATPVHQKYASFLPGFLAAVRAQTVPCELLVAVADGDPIMRVLQEQDVAYVTVPFLGTKYERVIAARNALIARFLAGQWTHLLFVDADVFLPPEAAAMLIENAAPIASGVYLSVLDIAGRPTVLPVAYGFANDPAYRAPIPAADVLAPRRLPVHSVGFGCCLIRRDVLKQVALRPYQGDGASEDIFFCIDARNAGFDTLLDTRVWAAHHCWPPGDQRNEYLTREWNLRTSASQRPG